jgi:hypothetical protein
MRQFLGFISPAHHVAVIRAASQVLVTPYRLGLPNPNIIPTPIRCEIFTFGRQGDSSFTGFFLSLDVIT